MNSEYSSLLRKSNYISSVASRQKFKKKIMKRWLLALTAPQRGDQSGCASEQQPPGYQQPFSAARWLLPGYSSILACHSRNVQHTACAAKFRLKMQMRSDVNASPELFIQRIHMLGTTNQDSPRVL